MIGSVEELRALAARDPGALLKPGEVAALFGVDPKTVGRWSVSGKLPQTRTPGGQRRFRADWIAAALGVQS